jgi:hypothetical protein
MAEVLVEFTETVLAHDGTPYSARACGGEARDGLWQGWIEFTPVGDGRTIRSGRETTQSTRQDTIYWATGLTAVYLEGALQRALTPRTAHPANSPAEAAYDEPAPPLAAGPPAPGSVMNPFSVYQKGEMVLRRQLGAMSAWHLVNIVRAHALSNQTTEALGRRTADELIELIVAAVKLRSDPTSVR